MAAEHIYLHGGLHKTGSTTIQATLFANRHRLLEAGISYWDITGNHSLPLRVAFSRAGNISGSLLWPPRKVQDHLRDALSRSQAKFVISGEGISRLSTEELVDLKAIIEESGPRTFTVIIYVRDPRSLYHSIVQEWLKKGGTLDNLSNRLHYRSRIENFINAFGSENVRLRQFSSSAFVGGSLVADFFTALDEPQELGQSFAAVYRNTSLSQQAVLLLDAVNRSAERDRSAGNFNWLAKEYLGRYLPGKPFRVPKEEVDRMLASLEGEIEWLSRELGANIVSSDVEEEVEARSDGVDFHQVGELVYRLAKELATQRAAEKYRLGMAALDRQGHAKARRLFQQSLKYVPDFPLAVDALNKLHREE